MAQDTAYYPWLPAAQESCCGETCRRTPPSSNVNFAEVLEIKKKKKEIHPTESTEAVEKPEHV